MGYNCSLVERLDLLPMAVLLMSGGKLPARRANSAHFVGHLPLASLLAFTQHSARCLVERQQPHRRYWLLLCLAFVAFPCQCKPRYGYLLSCRTKTTNRFNGEQKEAQKTSSSSTTLMAGSGLVCSCTLPLPFLALSLFDRDFSQSNTLDRGPDDGQATHLCSEDVNLVSPLANIDF